MRNTIPPGTQSIARAIDLLKVLGYRRNRSQRPLEEFTRDRIREVAKWMQAEARQIEREHHELINSAGC